MIYLFLANGFEEVEALAPLDILRRAGKAVTTVGIGGRQVTGAHGITVTADRSDAEVKFTDIEAVILPGGMPGASNLDASPVVDAALAAADACGAYLCAICAAPMVLGHRGYLDGYRATCYPGFEGRCTGAHMVDADVVTDGPVTTGRALGAAIPFALELVRLLTDEQTAARTAEEIVWRT